MYEGAGQENGRDVLPGQELRSGPVQPSGGGSVQGAQDPPDEGGREGAPRRVGGALPPRTGREGEESGQLQLRGGHGGGAPHTRSRLRDEVLREQRLLYRDVLAVRGLELC